MALNKNSKKADKIANLYRAAFYLAKGSNKMAMFFLNKSNQKFNGIKTNTKDERLFWAEKILDRYTQMKTALL